MQVIVTVLETGQIQVSATQSIGIDRILGILELGKESILETARRPAIAVANAADTKRLVEANGG